MLDWAKGSARSAATGCAAPGNCFAKTPLFCIRAFAFGRARRPRSVKNSSTFVPERKDADGRGRAREASATRLCREGGANVVEKAKTAFEKFQVLTKKLVRVPKAEGEESKPDSRTSESRYRAYGRSSRAPLSWLPHRIPQSLLVCSSACASAFT